MALTNDEMSDIRYFLGRSAYNRNDCYAPLREWEELNDALTQILVDDEDRVRDMLTDLRGIRTKVAEALGCMDIQQAGDTRFRNPAQVHNILRNEGRRLAVALAQFLGISIRRTPWGKVGQGFVVGRG